MKVDLGELKESVDQELIQMEQRRQALESQREHIEAVQRIVSGLEDAGGTHKVDATLLAGPNGRSQKKHWFRG